MTRDERKSLAVGSLIRHYENNTLHMCQRIHMWGWTIERIGFVYTSDIQEDYELISNENSYCVINPGLERKFRIQQRRQLLAAT